MIEAARQLMQTKPQEALKEMPTARRKPPIKRAPQPERPKKPRQLRSSLLKKHRHMLATLRRGCVRSSSRL
jgi:hypothetical protein